MRKLLALVYGLALAALAGVTVEFTTPYTHTHVELSVGVANAAILPIAGAANGNFRTIGNAPQITAGASVGLNGLITACEDVFIETPSSVPTDDLGNTYVAFGTAATDGGTGTEQCWSAINGSSGTPTVSFHNTGTNANVFVYVDAFTGTATSSVLIAAARSSALGSSTTLTCATANATAAGQLVFSFVGAQNGATSFAPHSSETEEFEETSFHQTQIQYRTTAGSGAIGASWTLGSAQAGGCVVGIFDLAVGGGGSFARVTAADTTCPLPTQGTTILCTYQAAVPGGALLRACAANFSGVTFNSASDQLNGSWSAEAAQFRENDNTAGVARCFRFENSSAGTPTVSINQSSSTTGPIFLTAYTGIAASSALVAASSANGGSAGLTSGTSFTCPSVTPTVTGQLIVSTFVVYQDVGTLSINNGETKIYDDKAFGVSERAASNTLAFTPKWTTDVSRQPGCSSAVYALVTTAASFSAGPSAVAASTTTWTITFTATAAANVKCGAWLYGTVPTAAQVNTGTNAHGTQTAVATGSSQTMTLTVSDGTPAPLYDLYCTADGGTSKSSLMRTYLTPGAGTQFITLSVVNAAGSIPATYNALNLKTIAHGAVTGGPYTLYGIVTGGTSNAYGIMQLDSAGTMTVLTLSGTFQNGEVLTDNHGAFSTASGSPVAYTQMEIGDVLVIPTTVSPTTAVLLTSTSSGHFAYNGATGRQTGLNGKLYDVSAQAYATIPIDFVDGDGVPLSVTKGTSPFVKVYKTGVAITNLDLNTLCSDADSDPMTFGRVGSVALPAGLSVTYLGILSGTPSVENEAGVTLSFLCVDTYQQSDVIALMLFPVTSWTLPNYAGQSFALAQANVNALTHNSVTVSSAPTGVCVGSGVVTSSSPASGQELAPFGTITLTMSTAACGGSGGLFNMRERPRRLRR